MLEVRGIENADRYAYNNMTTHEEENPETVFSELVTKNTGEDFIGSQPAPVENIENDFMLLGAGRDVVIYNSFGKLFIFGKFTGRNLDVEI